MTDAPLPLEPDEVFVAEFHRQATGRLEITVKTRPRPGEDRVRLVSMPAEKD